MPFDDLIAVWTDYFGKAFAESLDVDLVKALIASESSFLTDPPTNKIARGITQITRPTFAALTNENSEARAFTFRKITFEDLIRPEIAIPLGIRWLFSQEMARREKLEARAKRRGDCPRVQGSAAEQNGIQK